MRSAALSVKVLPLLYLLPPGCFASSFSSGFLAVVIFSALSRSALSATLRNTLPWASLMNCTNWRMSQYRPCAERGCQIRGKQKRVSQCENESWFSVYASQAVFVRMEETTAQLLSGRPLILCPSSTVFHLPPTCTSNASFRLSGHHVSAEQFLKEKSYVCTPQSGLSMSFSP